MEWDPHERAQMVALVEYRAGLCSGCGHPLAESTDPAHEGRYHVGLPRRCHACTPLEQEFEKYREATAPRALKWTSDLVRPVHQPQPPEEE